MESYFDKRKEFVVVNDPKSEEHEVDCNILQGSVLGPCMFGDYSSPVAIFHFYADDTQIKYSTLFLEAEIFFRKSMQFQSQ